MALLRTTTGNNHIVNKLYASQRSQNQSMLNQGVLGEFNSKNPFYLALKICNFDLKKEKKISIGAF